MINFLKDINNDGGLTMLYLIKKAIDIKIKTSMVLI